MSPIALKRVEGIERYIDKERIHNSIIRIDLLTPNIKYEDYYEGKMLITFQSGKQLNLKKAHFSNLCVGYEYYDEISDTKRYKKITYQEIKSIIFSSTVPLKSPVDGMLFPPDYKYDPRNGQKLIPLN